MSVMNPAGLEPNTPDVSGAGRAAHQVASMRVILEKEKKGVETHFLMGGRICRWWSATLLLG